MDDEEIVHRCDAPHEAELAAAYLRSHSIAARIDENLVNGMNPLWGLALGGIRVWVPTSEADRARDLLGALVPGASAAAAEGTPPGSPQRRERCVDTATEAGLGAAPLGSGQQEAATIAEDASARRALAVSLVGLFLCPGLANLYAIWLVLKLRPALLSSRGRRYLRMAVFVNVGLVVALLTVTVVGPHLDVELPERSPPVRQPAVPLGGR